MSLVAKRSLGRLSIKSTAFLLCDVQEKFRSGIHAFESVVQVSQKMSAASKILQIPLLVTEQYPRGLGATASEIPIDHAVINEAKTKFSMMTPGVTAKLEELQTKSVVLYGIEAHVCVMQTCLDLLDLNFDVHVLADGVSSMNYPEADIALKRMALCGAHVVSSESVIFQLTNDSKHPNFPAIRDLVKEHQEAGRQNKLLFKTAQL
ncbi:hypothetical protein GGI13_000836 [Coemansia sp. RSA 455]|nr:hypothetical protein LPJ71_003529 [Coemansia sp. S17]KAJ2016501.1 hypothetical protein GGI14_003593 [Coemansia sp. S680]KAJ2031575.1 hypothetical protein H4S03_006570 [Coemansia sp. S3946]KAJ2046394.1 hypothetical protein H4S04_005071 [Coemansia sp. S16]KAJ2070462.1 hypothetical protein GGH13_004008 [Coemansia sp. S155-1]KAJ2106684.1 hypothetical protein GGI16_001829 [Coemansia sp. S142-1]KAJ2116084.1 hypothetical protein IW146_001816 [Coemansia sp. RSA 922]KAJ2257654.1 hypothetical prote